ncbi:MAG: hypothetical protein WDA11_03865, partial [Thiohalomonadaceae bacterium]
MSKLTSIKPFTFALCVAGALVSGPVMAADNVEEGKKPEQEQGKNEVQERASQPRGMLLVSEAEDAKQPEQEQEGSDVQKRAGQPRGMLLVSEAEDAKQPEQEQ